MCRAVRESRCSIQLFRPKEKTKSHRHTSTTVYHGFRGSGLTKVSANNLDWDQGDIFVVPSWQWHSHENMTDEDAILFSITDRPAAEVLGLNVRMLNQVDIGGASPAAA